MAQLVVNSKSRPVWEQLVQVKDHSRWPGLSRSWGLSDATLPALRFVPDHLCLFGIACEVLSMVTVGHACQSGANACITSHAHAYRRSTRDHYIVCTCASCHAIMMLTEIPTMTITVTFLSITDIQIPQQSSTECKTLGVSQPPSQSLVRMHAQIWLCV